MCLLKRLCPKSNRMYIESEVERVDYKFPVPNGRVTTGFWDLRPYSKKVDDRTYIHRAWDLAGGKPRSVIVAPEDGKVIYQVQFRCPLTKTQWLKWPDTGESYLFSHWYFDSMGAVIVFVGDSGYIYSFAHVDVDDIFHLITIRQIQYEWERKGRAYNDYIQSMVTLQDPKHVDRGEIIGHIGHSGFSTAYHTHMQVHADRRYDSRIDPAELWPNREINDNGVGPMYGARSGADHIPARMLDFDYIRNA